WQRTRDRHANFGRGDRGRGVWRGVDGPAAGRGVSVHRFYFGGLRSADQLRGEVSLSLGRGNSGGVPWSMWLRRAFRSVSLTERGGVFSKHRGTEDRRAVNRLRCEGT